MMNICKNQNNIFCLNLFNYKNIVTRLGQRLHKLGYVEKTHKT